MLRRLPRRVGGRQASQILIDHFRLGLLPLFDQARCADLKQRAAQNRGNRDNHSRMRNPHSVDHVEGVDAVRKGLGYQNRDFRLCSALVFPQFGKPTIAPILCSLGLPEDGAGHHSSGTDDPLNGVSPKLAFLDWLDRVMRKVRSQQAFELKFLYLSLELLRTCSDFLLAFNRLLHRGDCLVLFGDLEPQTVLGLALRVQPSIGEPSLNTFFNG